ncbi:MAG: hypothetical protein M1840_005099 [Geoglossum simile]|nr:MAG: hypothetical protein M1840_005099 [Geoglossum simile]
MASSFSFKSNHGSPGRQHDSGIVGAGVPGALGLALAPNAIHDRLRRAAAPRRETQIVPEARWSMSMEALSDLLEVKKEQPQQDGHAPSSAGDGLGISVGPVGQVDETDPAEVDSVPSRKSSQDPSDQATLQLVCPTDGSLDEEAAAVDIIFVCGLGGHYVNTWKSPNNSKFVWMGEALRTYAPQARVYAYKYNTRLWRRGEIAKQAEDLLRCIRELPQRPPPADGHRPIIFVGHSTGGLIVKKLLLEAAKEEQWIIRSCLGILFFACPHQGFHSPAEVLVAVSPRLSGHPPDICRASTIKDVFRDLQSTMESGFDEDLLRKSKFLVTLDTDFKKLDLCPPTLSYYTAPEAACTTIGPLEITFPTESATLGVPKDTTIAVAKDHFFICKYDDIDDKLFIPLALAIRRMIDTSPDREVGPRGALRKPTTQARTPPTPRHIPALEENTEVSVVEFYKWQVTGDGSAPTWGSVQPGEVQKIRLSDLIQHGPLTCVQKSRDRGSTDVSSVRGLGGSQCRYEFRWIHVPELVESWAERVIRKISEETTDSTIANDLLAEEVWTKRRHRASHRVSHARFMEPTCTGLPSNPTADAAWGNWQQARQGSLILYMPYLHWDTFDSHQNRRKCLQGLEQRAGDHTLIPPNHPTISTVGTGGTLPTVPPEARTLEHQLLEEYWRDHRPIHARRSLDGFYYPNIRDLEARDRDQVLYKHTRDPSSGLAISKMLMVDQLWMWVISDHTILTFFPPNHPLNIPVGLPPNQQLQLQRINELYKETDLYNNVCETLHKNGSERVESTLDMVALLLGQAVSVLLSQTDQAEMRIADCFREYIDSLTARQTQSLETFRNYLNIAPPTNTLSHTSLDTLALQTRVSDPLSIRKELDMVVNVRDTVDELGSLQRLFEVQGEVVKKAEALFREAERTHRGGERSALKLMGVAGVVREFNSGAERLIEAAKRTQDSLHNLLDLKQKEANVSEARSGNLQALAVKQQGKTILIFTVVTIIFLPLNFLTSLFGVNARELTGQNGRLSFRTIGLYTGTIASAVVSICFLIAFNNLFRVLLFETCDFVLVVLTTAWAYLVEYTGIRGVYRRVVVAGEAVRVRAWLVEKRRALGEKRGYQLKERYIGV